MEATRAHALADIVARPRRVVFRFALYTALALALAAGGLLWFVGRDATARAERAVSFHAGFVASTILRDRLRESDFQHPLTGPRVAELDRLFRREVLVGGAVRVALRSSAGVVTYSSDHALVGSSPGRPGTLAGVLGGRAMRGVARIDSVGAGRRSLKVLEAYVPVSLPGATRPSGVFDFYQEYGPVAAAAHDSVVAIAVALALALLLLYAALFPILRRVTVALEARNRRLREQNERLLELDRLKDEFIALVSHELRTPLTSIRGYLELVLDGEAGELGEEQRQFLTVVDRNSERLLHLVGDLLFVAQVEAGKLGLERGEVDLAVLAAEAVEASLPVAAGRGVGLRASAGSPVPVRGDRARLAQLIDNLVSNALKFTPAGGKVEVRVAAEGARARLEVADTGLGIPAAEQERLFERFFRTRAAGERAIQGTGLGLTITKAIAEAHGGTIGVESAEGMGTTFRVEIPLFAGLPAAAVPQGAVA